MAGFGGWLRGLVGKEEPAPSLPHAGTRPSGPRSFGEEGSDFALALYRQLQQRPGNLFFSPFSIRTALGLPQAGAKGETAAALGTGWRAAATWIPRLDRPTLSRRRKPRRFPPRRRVHVWP
jgi:hypothetical protein